VPAPARALQPPRRLPICPLSRGLSEQAAPTTPTDKESDVSPLQ